MHWMTALIGIGCLMMLLMLRRMDKKMPTGAIMLGIVAARLFAAFCLIILLFMNIAF